MCTDILHVLGINTLNLENIELLKFNTYTLSQPIAEIIPTALRLENRGSRPGLEWATARPGMGPQPGLEWGHSQAWNRATARPGMGPQPGLEWATAVTERFCVWPYTSHGNKVDIVP